jgi:hypothetical protein
MKPFYFFDLPVYRLDRDTYYTQREEWIKKKLYKNPSSKKFYKKYPENKMFMEDHLIEYYGGSWEYNEIIGYLRLHILGTQIRGEYWQHKAKKLVRSRKRQFKYITHKLSAEKEFLLSGSNKEIYNDILEYIEMCKKTLKKRCIDTSNFEKIGPHIDWKGLIANNL